MNVTSIINNQIPPLYLCLTTYSPPVLKNESAGISCIQTLRLL
jgi:hypothetical protein